MDNNRRNLLSGMAGLAAASAVASTTASAAEQAKSEAIYPPDRKAYDAFSYAAAIRSGDFLFVSGQLGNRPDGSPEPDYSKQVAIAFENLAEVLKAAGCTFADIIDVTTFHTDPAKQIEAFSAVREKVLGGPPYTNWTAVGVTWLSGFDVEIKVIARIPKAA